MAIIKIRGRLEEIIVSNERAIRIKQLWAGDPGKNISPSPKTDIVDLGAWTGELGRIVSIELNSMEIKRENAVEIEQRRQDERTREWVALPAEEKAKSLSMFKTSWFVRKGMIGSKDPPDDVLEAAYQIALKFYKKNPESLFVPSNLFAKLLDHG